MLYIHYVQVVKYITVLIYRLYLSGIVRKYSAIYSICTGSKELYSAYVRVKLDSKVQESKIFSVCTYVQVCLVMVYSAVQINPLCTQGMKELYIVYVKINTREFCTQVCQAVEDSTVRKYNIFT